MRRLANGGLALALAVAVAFLLLPLAALFVQVPLGTLVAQLGSPVFLDALTVSLVTSAIAHAVVLAVGTPLAYVLATRRFAGRPLVVSALELPLVLPPAVAGIGLLAAFGRVGLLGGALSALGVSLPFSRAAVVLAVIFVSSPFYLRAAIAAFGALDPALLEASRTLGAGPFRTFARVALPVAAGGLAAGSSLAWARGLGEFGATIVFAGNLRGETQTLPLAIYSQLDVHFDVALATGALLVLVSIALLALVKLLPLWTRSRSGSPTASAPSAWI